MNDSKKKSAIIKNGAKITLGVFNDKKCLNQPEFTSQCDSKSRDKNIFSYICNVLF